MSPSWCGGVPPVGLCPSCGHEAAPGTQVLSAEPVLNTLRPDADVQNRVTDRKLDGHQDLFKGASATATRRPPMASGPFTPFLHHKQPSLLPFLFL